MFFYYFYFSNYVIFNCVRTLHFYQLDIFHCFGLLKFHYILMILLELAETFHSKLLYLKLGFLFWKIEKFVVSDLKEML